MESPLFDSDEMEILLGIAEGMSIKEIAKEHDKNERSLENKSTRMKKKVHARTAAQLVAMAYHLGILIPRVIREV
jgi:DNA-binding NarL/FixJ family response regulator